MLPVSLKQSKGKLLLSLAVVLGLAGSSQAQMTGRMTSTTVPEEPSVNLPSDRPTWMTSLNYPLIYGAYAMWPYAIPVTLSNNAGLPSRLNDISMRPTPVITRAYRPSVLPTATSALISVELPASAELWFEGMRVPNSGALRRFASPDLNPLKAYTYDVRATWTEGNQVVTQGQRVVVRSGDRLTITFPLSQPAGQGPSLRPVLPQPRESIGEPRRELPASGAYPLTMR
jgi:uncharacterized protein (TIGR03000 family)